MNQLIGVDLGGSALKLGRFSLTSFKSAFEPRAPQSLQANQGNSLSG